MTQVTVDRRVIWGLGVALVLALIGLAFVLGRASAPAPAANPTAAAVQGPLSPPLGTPSHGPEAAPWADSSGPSGTPPLVEDPNPSMASLATPLPSGSERPAVQAYFAALDALQAQGLGSDPQGLAYAQSSTSPPSRPRKAPCSTATPASSWAAPCAPPEFSLSHTSPTRVANYITNATS